MRRLAAMSEVEREAVLYERAQARLAKTERRELEKKMRELESGGSARPARAPSAAVERKRRTLDELRSRRERRGRRDSDSDYFEEGEVQDRRAKPLNEHSRGESSDYEDGGEGSRAKGAKKTASRQGAVELIDLSAANELRLSRDTVAKWVFHPDFDELCRGFLLRLSIGMKGGEQVYRLVEVKKVVKYHRNYKINNVTTNKAAVLKYGRQEKTFRLDVISNSEFTLPEFERWMGTMKEEHQPIITKSTAQARTQSWLALEARPLSDEVVSLMVAAKRELGAAPRNLVAERTMLLHLRQEAQGTGNGAEVERIDEDLAQLAKEQAFQPVRNPTDSRLEALAELSKRNRRLNIANAREAERKNTQRSSAGDSRHDPFSRRKCQPTNFNSLYAPHHAAEADVQAEAEKRAGAVESQGSALSTQSPTPPPPTEEPHTDPSQDVRAVTPTAGPVDLFAAHNLDIDIDI